MLDNLKMGRFICEQRRRRSMTQQQLADELGITFQAVSKWENGIVFPNIEILPELSRILQVTVDDLLRADISDKESLSYGKAGVDIAYSDALKKDMAKLLVWVLVMVSGLGSC